MLKNRKISRLQGYNYSFPGCYFVTICTQHKIEWFGEIIDKRMILSKIGKFAERFWQEIPNHYGTTKLDKLIVMPNHIHGIITIAPVGTPPRRVPIVGFNPQIKTNLHHSRHPGPLQKNSLSSIINQFKGAVKRECNKTGFNDFKWQPRFHDHIIRNKYDLNRIRKYIESNPMIWHRDHNNEMNNQNMS